MIRKLFAFLLRLWFQSLFFCIFNAIIYRIPEIYRLHKQILRIKDGDEFPMILIGNKCDLQRQRTVNSEMIDELTSELKIKFMETSAKTRQNVEEAFYELVRQIRDYQLKERPPLNVATKQKKQKIRCNLL